MNDKLFDNLEKIIKKELRIGVDKSESSNFSVIIKEDDPSSKIQKLYLKGFNRVFAFKMDSAKINCICNIFDRNDEFVNKGCDAIIISEIDNNLYIFVCELKSDNVKGYTKQIKNGHAFIEYLKYLLEKCYEPRSNLKPYKIINILLTTKPDINKQMITNRDYKLKPVKENDIDVFKESCKNEQTIYIRKFI